jgi:serine protease Do
MQFRYLAGSRWNLKVLGAGLAALLLTASVSGAILAADATDAKANAAAASTADSVSQSLRHLLDGAAPMGVTDLRAMQSHVQQLADRLKKCTVGVQVGRAWGSGVIISKEGYVLTAAHVAGRPNQDCTFELYDGRKLKGRTLGLYRSLDAGLMKITEEGELPCAEIGNSGKLHEGQWCIAMGHPGGFQSERGAVLRLGRVLLVQNDAITTNCTLVGGDSGGPLFDMDGRVIGINSRISELLTTNMHVPVNAYHDHDAWDRMVKGDEWGHMLGHEPWLGVGGDGESKEAKIASVKPKSPAEHYGLKPGDIVVAFDDQTISDFAALTRAVSDCQPNESIVLRVRRGEELQSIRVRLGRKPE